MKLLITFILFFSIPHLALSQVSEKSLPPEHLQLRILTLNMKIGLYGLEKVAHEIRKTNPDIVLLQEVLGQQFISGFVDQAKYLAEDLGMHYRFGRAHLWLSGEYGLATLSRFPIVDSEVFPLPNLSGEEPEVLLRTRIQTPKGIVAVYNIHLIFKARHDDHRAAPLRFEQAKFIVNQLLAETHPLIVGGDLNAFGLSPVKRIFRKHYVDVFKKVGKGWGATFPAGFPLYKIDYLFVGPTLVPKESRVLDLNVSDHRGLFSIVFL